MDVLASLNLDDLPEQQTVLNQSIEDALEKDPSIRLGFDVCCFCAKSLLKKKKSSSSSSDIKVVKCKKCKRVRYCSKECREKDKSSAAGGGHTSVVCLLLNVCNADEAADNDSNNNIDEETLDRVRSERESYPATLANILFDGPCYQPLLKSIKKRQDRKLTIHVIGASDAEVWDENIEPSPVFDAYTEALTEMIETHGIRSLDVRFIGPHCPKKSKVNTISLEGSGGISTISFKSINQHYHLVVNESPPDVVLFFNPGFTCPDYEWKQTLQSIPKGTSFLITTNTEMEGAMDSQYLFENGFTTSMPDMAQILLQFSTGDLSDGSDDEDNMPAKKSELFLAENPYAGSRVRQSGNFANDLFVKNRWMLGGLLVPEEEEQQIKKRPVDCDEVDIGGRPRTKKHKKL